MATKDNSSGLLSKMAKFVRNPTKDWSELDAPEPEQESGYSKLALKEMIQRKRQNDFVRRREFDQLRKLRRNGPSISPDVAGRPSFFQSSLASNPDERAMTLRKIDEIEAQMSKQWWKGKQDEAALHGDNFPISAKTPLADGVPAIVAPPDSTSTFAITLASELSPESDPLHAGDGEPTQMGLTEPAGGLFSHEPQPMMAASSFGSRNFDTGASGFSSSNLFSVELGDSLDDPDLEEAAIRFANGDDAGAEAGLLAALKGDHVEADSAKGWAAALFDLYRGTGQQASFDRVAIDFAERFGHSAPAWFSTPDLLGRNALTPSTGPLAVPVSGRECAWECPAELDLQSVQAMVAGLPSGAGAPWYLNWSRLATITPDAGQALAELFSRWCSQAVTLHFVGAEVLEKTLRSFTPSGDKRVDAFWWRLRLDALRILRLQDEFELAALDFCVIYEVSPPPWQDARCRYAYERADEVTAFDTDADAPGAEPDYPVDQSQALTAPMGFDALPAAVVELNGEVLGDAAEALDKLQAGLKGADRLVISCDRLIRVDFSAAGSVLNWVAVRQAEGCRVQFRDVPRLVAAFFNVIGINEHAKVMLRNR